MKTRIDSLKTNIQVLNKHSFKERAKTILDTINKTLRVEGN